MRSMAMAVEDELVVAGSETRARILASFNDTLQAIEALAHGITIQKTDYTKDEPEEVVYTVPPFWPALKWLAEWGRQIIREEPKKVEEHRMDDETRQLLKDFVRGVEREKPKQIEGVFQLGRNGDQVDQSDINNQRPEPGA